MYMLNIDSAIKKMTVKNSETLSMITFINESDLLKKVVIVQWII